MQRLEQKRIMAALRRLLIIILTCIPLIGIAQARSGSSANEYEIKAAFLYNFANFIDWPSKTSADSNNTFVIGVCGDNPFNDSLEKIVSGKTINGRKIEIKYYKSYRDIKPCHILFVSQSEDSHIGKISGSATDWHMLTVGESSSFTRNGGVIAFYVEDRKIKFEINTANAKKADLKISSKLLKLARIVRG